MNRHRNQNTIELNLPPAAKNQPGLAVIGVHGRYQEANFLLPYIEQLGWGKEAIILPEASELSWYPDKFMAPIEKNEEALKDALNIIQEKHHQVKKLGFRDDQILWIGFSQGACLLAQYTLSNPSLYRGICILTGGYIGPQDYQWNYDGDLNGTKVYLSTAKNDEWVPPSRVEESAKLFKSLHAEVEVDIFEERAHEISTVEIDRMKALFGK